jgi:hypothetical protein
MNDEESRVARRREGKKGGGGQMDRFKMQKTFHVAGTMNGKGRIQYC